MQSPETNVTRRADSERSSRQSIATLSCTENVLAVVVRSGSIRRPRCVLPQCVSCMEGLGSDNPTFPLRCELPKHVDEVQAASLTPQ